MRLKTTKIKNFQSLSTIEIEHGDLTVLWGSSDLGKSACIRAIRALHRNTSSSDNIRHGQAKLKIEQEFEDGTKISFEKSKTTNAYFIKDKVLSKVGRDVPEDVAEALQTDKLLLDKDQSLDLNFSTQFEGPFLLADSSSIITKTISSLSGIHYIYSALREAASQASKLKSQSQVLISNISSLEKFDSLQVESEELVKHLGILIGVDGNIETLAEEVEGLTTILTKMATLEQRQFDPFEVSNKFKGIQDSFYQINDQSMGIQELKELLAKIDKKPSHVEDFELKLSEIKDIHGKLITVLSNKESQENGYNELSILYTRYKLLEVQEQDTAKKIMDYVVEIDDIKKKITICETCGRIL